MIIHKQIDFLITSFFLRVEYKTIDKEYISDGVSDK